MIAISERGPSLTPLTLHEEGEWSSGAAAHRTAPHAPILISKYHYRTPSAASQRRARSPVDAHQSCFAPRPL
jgi:hypothetical protein